MKVSMLCLAVCLLLGMAGCSPEHERVGDAPKTITASPVDGWQEISTSGVTLRLPPDWKVMDLVQSKMEEGLDRAFGNDPKFADLRKQTSDMAKQGQIKLV